MTHGEAWWVRPCIDDDAPAVSAFFAATHAADPVVRLVSVEQWRTFHGYAGNRGGVDFVLAEAAGRVAGVLTSTVLDGTAHGRTRRHLRIVVLPALRRRGLGSALLRTAAAQTLDGPRPTLQAYVPAGWTASLAFYARHGFARVATDLEMDRDGPPPEEVLPPGYRLRPYGLEGDAAEWARIHNLAFSAEFTFERFDAERTADEMRLPGARAVVGETPDGRVAGFCFTHTADATKGCVQSLAVDPSHRGRGLGRALLVAGLRALAGEGRSGVELSVEGGNTVAQALYRSVGFRVREESYTLWRGRKE